MKTTDARITRVSVSPLGYRRAYMGENCRIEFGFHIAELDKSYQLQRRRWWGWKNVAWTYNDIGLSEIINYLFWYEQRQGKTRETRLF